MDSSTRAQDMLRRFAGQPSTAALRSAAASERTRIIVVALAANLVVAFAKLAAGMLTGSAALLAEAGHSFADSLNEVLLGVSLRRGNVPADAAHPLGHGRERFLWAFMAAIASFLIVGCLSIALGVQKLLVGGSESNLLVAWLVLGVASIADGVSLLQSLRSARREADGTHRSLWRRVLHSSDPTLRAIIVEDVAALVGLGLAAIGLAASALLGDSRWDAVASILIGLLLATTAFGLAWPLSDYLVGRSVTARWRSEYPPHRRGLEYEAQVHGIDHTHRSEVVGHHRPLRRPRDRHRRPEGQAGRRAAGTRQRRPDPLATRQPACRRDHPVPLPRGHRPGHAAVPRDWPGHSA